MVGRLFRYKVESLKKLLAIAVILCGIQNANAAFLDHDTYLTDTQSGLDWLDVTASVNRSFVDVTSRFGIGGLFEGWRYASAVEFDALVTNWTGSSSSPYSYRIWPESVGSIDGLVVALGSTVDVWWIGMYNTTWDASYGYSEGSGLDYTVGILRDQSDAVSRYIAYIYDYDTEARKEDDWTNSKDSSMGRGESREYVGSYLVRDTVPDVPVTSTIPESPTIALFGLGLAGLGFIRRSVKP